MNFIILLEEFEIALLNKIINIRIIYLKSTISWRTDEGKKNKDAFLYAGYLVFEFKLKDELLYKIQIDYTNIDTSDIKSRMSCVIESFLTI